MNNYDYRILFRRTLKIQIFAVLLNFDYVTADNISESLENDKVDPHNKKWEAYAEIDNLVNELVEYGIVYHYCSNTINKGYNKVLLEMDKFISKNIYKILDINNIQKDKVTKKIINTIQYTIINFSNIFYERLFEIEDIENRSVFLSDFI